MSLVGDLDAALGQQIPNVTKGTVTLACSTITRPME
jgi:hypothetical protein